MTDGKLIECFFISGGASQKEKETFVFLLEYKVEYALDFINCWLLLNKKEKISEQSLSTFKERAKIHIPTKKNKRKKNDC